MYDKHADRISLRLISKACSRRKNEIKSEILECLKSRAPEEMTRKEIVEILENKGVKIAVGTFYNAVSELRNRNLVISRRSSIAFYRYNRDKNETYRVGDRNRGLVSEQGFVSSVCELARANGFDEISRIHDIHLKTSFWDVDVFSERVGRCPEVWYGESCWKWKRNEKAKGWVIKLMHACMPTMDRRQD